MARRPRGGSGRLGDTWESSGSLKSERLGRDSKWRRVADPNENVGRNTARDLRDLRDAPAKHSAARGGAKGSVAGAAVRNATRLASRVAGVAAAADAGYQTGKVGKGLYDTGQEKRKHVKGALLSDKTKDRIKSGEIGRKQLQAQAEKSRKDAMDAKLPEVKVTAQKKERAKPKAQPKAAPSKKKMSGDELADFLGLSKDSAIRKNMRAKAK